MQPEMKYIYAVYQAGSFSKAAQQLYMTQPALSISVQKTEMEIGMPIFNRDKKPLELTEAGRLYVTKIEEIMHLEAELDKQLGDLSRLRIGSLTIGGSHYFNAYILPPVLADYHERWPGIHLNLTEADSYTLLDMLKENKVDLTFNCTPSPKDTFRREPGFQDTLLLAVPRTLSIDEDLQPLAMTAADVLAQRYEDADCPTVTMAPFETTPFILLTPGNNLLSRSKSWFQEAGYEPIITMQVSQLVTAYNLARAGLGATFISNWMVTEEYDDMHYFKIDSPLAIRVFDIVASGRNYLSNAEKAFIRLFRGYYGNSLGS